MPRRRAGPQASEAAGARCLYPVGVPDVVSLQAVLAAVRTPVNVIADPVDGSAAGSLEDLARLGVRRVTFGPFLQRRLAPALTDLVQPWR